MEGRTRGRINLGGETLSGETKPEKTTETKLTKIAQRSKEGCRREFKWLIQHVNRLAKYSLSMNEEKTKLVSFSKIQQAAGKQQGIFDFLGFTFYMAKSRKGYWMPKIKTSKVRMKAKLKRVRE